MDWYAGKIDGRNAHLSADFESMGEDGLANGGEVLMVAGFAVDSACEISVSLVLRMRSA